MTTEELESHALTDAQRDALRTLHERSDKSWSDFLWNAQPPTGVLRPYVWVPFAGMMIGIEPDGYTHS